MDGWIVWLLVALGFGIAEVISGSAFYLAPFAIGAVIAAGAEDALGEGVSVAVFLVASIATLMLLRPIVTSRLFNGPNHTTNAQALIGKSAVVLEPITGRAGDGRIKIDGEIWSAKALYADTEIAAGAEVQVIKIDGATALVIE